MKSLLAVAFATSLSLFATPVVAMDSMSGTMAKPQCAAGDPAVAVNTQTKMYLTSDQVSAKMAGMTAEQKQMAAQKSHAQWMCKSKADAMGAKPAASSMPGAMSTSSSHM